MIEPLVTAGHGHRSSLSVRGFWFKPHSECMYPADFRPSPSQGDADSPSVVRPESADRSRRPTQSVGPIDQQLRLPTPRYMNHRYPGNEVIAGLAEVEEFFFFEVRRLLGESGDGHRG